MRIAQACFAFAQASGDICLCLYHVTAMYFEAEKEDDLRGKRLTILSVVEAFTACHGTEDMVVVTDARMPSASNLTKLDNADYRFVVGPRSTKAPIDLESHFRWHGEVFTKANEQTQPRKPNAR